MLNIRLHHRGIRFSSTLYSNTISCCKNHFAKCELAGVRSQSKRRNGSSARDRYCERGLGVFVNWHGKPESW